MSAIASLVVSLLSSLLPLIGGASASAIDNIINLLTEIIPAAVNEAEDLVTPIQNIIAALNGSGNVTAAQVGALQAASALLDVQLVAVAKADGLTTGDDAAGPG